MAARQTEINDVGMRLLNRPPECVKIGRLGRSEMVAQRVDIVDSKLRRDKSRKFGQVHTGLAVIPAVVGGTFYVRSKRPGCHRQPVSGFGWKVKFGLVLGLLTTDENRTAEREQ